MDLDGQIVDPGFAKKALDAWFRDFANIRQMHSGALPPAGVGANLEHKADGPWLKAEVYEPGAMQQVSKGGYRAYSIGIAQPRLRRDVQAPNGRIVGGEVVEVSLVDHPANRNTKFALTTKNAKFALTVKEWKGGSSIKATKATKARGVAIDPFGRVIVAAASGGVREVGIITKAAGRPVVVKRKKVKLTKVEKMARISDPKQRARAVANLLGFKSAMAEPKEF